MLLHYHIIIALTSILMIQFLNRSGDIISELEQIMIWNGGTIQFNHVQSQVCVIGIPILNIQRLSAERWDSKIDIRRTYIITFACYLRTIA